MLPSQDLVFCDASHIELDDNELYYMVYQYIHCFCFYIILQSKQATQRISKKGMDPLEPLTLNAELAKDLFHYLKKNVRSDIVIRMLSPDEILESLPSDTREIYMKKLIDLERKELVRSVAKYIHNQNESCNNVEYMKALAFAIIHLFPSYKNNIGVQQGSEIFFDAFTNKGYLVGPTYRIQNMRKRPSNTTSDDTPKSRGRPKNNNSTSTSSLAVDSDMECSINNLKGLIIPDDEPKILNLLKQTAAYRKAKKIRFENPFDDFSFFLTNPNLVSIMF